MRPILIKLIEDQSVTAHAPLREQVASDTGAFGGVRMSLFGSN